MSKKSIRSRGKQRIISRQQPAILSTSRKRKLDSEVSMDFFEDNESENLQLSKNLKINSDELWSPLSTPDCETASCSSFQDEFSSPFSTSESDSVSSKVVSHASWTQFRGIYSPSYVAKMSRIPVSLPRLSFADPTEVWDLMSQKEVKYTRDVNMLARHPSLQARMRSILLDWLIEVCEVYKLHRETFYLAQDFIDRYIGLESNIPKQRLQLIGITALFVTAKIEEIYPPKLTEFVYVTDGACTDEDILTMELILLRILKWELTPMTANSWLTVYLQLLNLENISKEDDNFLLPDFSSQTFINISQLLDLCILDIGCLKFTYSILAASALYHYSSAQIALSVSGFKWSDLAQCTQWMMPFATTIRESEDRYQHRFLHGETPDEQHNIQIHNVDLSLLENAQEKQKIMDPSSRSSPILAGVMLTPPKSEETNHMNVNS